MPKSAEEFEELTEVLDKWGGGTHVWIGIRSHGYCPYRRTWKWLDGTGISKSDDRWASGHPRAYSCVELAKNHGEWKLIDQCCRRKYPVICQLESRFDKLL